jgi:hypothetical protein
MTVIEVAALTNPKFKQQISGQLLTLGVIVGVLDGVLDGVCVIDNLIFYLL